MNQKTPLPNNPCPTFDEALKETREAYLAGVRKHIRPAQGLVQDIAEAALTMAGEGFQIGFQVGFKMAREFSEQEVPSPPFPLPAVNSENSVNSVHQTEITRNLPESPGLPGPALDRAPVPPATGASSVKSIARTYEQINKTAAPGEISPAAPRSSNP